VKKIDIKGRIISTSNKWIYNWLGIPATSPQDISSALFEANGDDIEIYVNSGGGSVYDGYEIYNLIREYNGNVTFKIIGLAASAASFICMAAKCLMSPLAEVMIHNASTYAEGPHQSMDSTSNMLQITDHTIATAYMLKSGKTEDEIRNLMENETWLSAEDCKNLGLIDGIMFEEGGESNVNNSNPAPTLYNAISDDTLMCELEKCNNVEDLKKKLTENIDKVFAEATMTVTGPSNEAKVKNSACQCSDCSQNAEECKCADCGQCPGCCENPQQCGCGCDEESCGQCTVTDNCKKTKKNGGKKMDVQTLKNQHKDIYDQVVNEATSNERNRIKAIEDLAIPGNEDIINKAKFETGATAEAVAVDIIKAQKEKGLNYIKDAKADAIDAKVNEVKEIPIDNKSKEENQKEAVNLIANAANKGR
jgi:ATP-dependent Clp protease protease subunit